MFHPFMSFLRRPRMHAGDTKKRCDPICIAVLETCPTIQCIAHCPRDGDDFLVAPAGGFVAAHCTQKIILTLKPLQS